MKITNKAGFSFRRIFEERNENLNPILKKWEESRHSYSFTSAECNEELIKMINESPKPVYVTVHNFHHENGKDQYLLSTTSILTEEVSL